MTNPYYNHSTYPAPNAPGSSAALRAELNLIMAAFDLLPTLSGNAYKVAMINAAGTAIVATSALQSLAITGSTLDSTPIGATTRAAGSFTNLSVNGTAGLGSSVTIAGGAIDGTPIGATTPSTGSFTSLSASSITLDGATVVTTTAVQTLTNKTLTSPVIATISNTGTLTLPTSTDTLVGRATTDTLTNKTISGASNTLSNIGNSALTNSSLTIGSTSVSLGGTATTIAGLTLTTPTLSATASGTTAGRLGYSAGAVTFGDGSVQRTVVTLDDTQTLTGKTISGASNTFNNIGNSALTNSALTIGSTSISLGGTSTTLAGLSSVTATSFVGALTGNASTVTDGVYTTGTYSNPAWITALAGSKITGNISGNAANVSGTVAVANGGTGSTTAAAARVALLPTMTGNAGKVAAVNAGGTDIEYIVVAGTGTVTSIDISGGTTGLSATGGPITTTGTFTLGGTLAIANGGTGSTTASDARTALGIAIGTNVQAWDGDLDAIAALTGTTGLLKKNAANTWTLDTNAYLQLAGGTMTGNLTVNNGTDSRVLLQVSGATQAQFQATTTAIRLASNNTTPLVFATDGVDRVTFDNNGNVTFGAVGASGVFKVQGLNTGDLVVFESTDASGTAAPDVVLYRNSASPLATDQLGVLIWRGKDSGGADQQYARIGADITSPTAGAEAGSIWFETVTAGAAAERFRIGAAGQWGIGGAAYGTSGQAMLSGGSSAAPSWGDVVTPTGTQTLTNKTLTAPVISTIVNTGTLTLPTSTDTLVGRATTDTLTNKTLTSPVINTATASGITLNDGYTEEVFAITGTTPALSPTNGSIQTWTLSANSTPTAGTWAAGQSITLMIDDGTAYTITWTSLAVTWKTDGGVAPTLNTTGLTAIALWKVGSTIYGARVGDA